MDAQHDFSGIDAISHGDARQARQLRASIAVIARRTTDPDLRRLCEQVLHGHQSVRRVFEHPAFWQMAGAHLDNLEEGLRRLDDPEREDLLSRVGHEQTDDADLEAMREGSGPAAEEPSAEDQASDGRHEDRPAERRPGWWG